MVGCTVTSIMDPNLSHRLILQHPPMVTAPITNRDNLTRKWWKISLISTGKTPGGLYRERRCHAIISHILSQWGWLFLSTTPSGITHPGGDITLQIIVWNISWGTLHPLILVYQNPPIFFATIFIYELVIFRWIHLGPTCTIEKLS